MQNFSKRLMKSYLVCMPLSVALRLGAESESEIVAESLQRSSNGESRQVDRIAVVSFGDGRQNVDGTIDSIDAHQDSGDDAQSCPWLLMDQTNSILKYFSKGSKRYRPEFETLKQDVKFNAIHVMSILYHLKYMHDNGTLHPTEAFTLVRTYFDMWKPISSVVVVRRGVVIARILEAFEYGLRRWRKKSCDTEYVQTYLGALIQVVDDLRAKKVISRRAMELIAFEVANEIEKTLHHLVSPTLFKQLAKSRRLNLPTSGSSVWQPSGSLPTQRPVQHAELRISKACALFEFFFGQKPPRSTDFAAKIWHELATTHALGPVKLEIRRLFAKHDRDFGRTPSQKMYIMSPII